MRLRLDQLIYGLLLVLAVSLPFEPIQPPVSFGFFNLNHLKILEAAIALLWLLSLTRPGALRDLPRETWLGGLFLGVALLSAMLAETQRSEAIKFVGRLASGMFGLLVVYQVVRKRPERMFGLLWAITLGAGVSALLGLGEVAGWPVLDPVLSVFKLAPTRVGATVRLGASFQYATIAAVFFELAVPLALVLAATQRDRRRWILATGLAALGSVAVVFTITRAGIVALGAALVLLFALAVARPRWRRLALPTALAGAAGALALGGLAVGMRNFDSRFETENDWGWYAASYDAPSTITLAPGAPTDAVITARNTGEVAWTAGGPQSFALGYRWLSADAASQLDMPATVLDLPHDVAPGDAVEMKVNVATRLPPGDYRLAWGMLQQQVLWFHDRGYPDAQTVVHVQVEQGVSPSSTPAVALRPRSDLAPVLPPVPRAELWSAALGMARQHPLLGVGPDNFRHIYGTYLGLSAWDDRVHANNLYLELLADVGVLGTLAFGALVALPIAGLVRGLRTRAAPRQAILLAGLCASLLAYFLHSGLDAFLDFTSVYLLFWVIVGLTIAALELDTCELAGPAG